MQISLFTKFYIEKPRIGIKRILLLFFFALPFLLINLQIFTCILVVILSSIFIFTYFNGYNIVLHEFWINNDMYSIIDNFIPFKKTHIRKVVSNFGKISSINISSPKTNDYLAGIEKFISKKDKDILHIGGGTCSTPILLNAFYPDIKHTVIEIEPQMVKAAKTFFLPYSNRNKINQINTDAKDYILKNKESYDVIIQDILLNQDNTLNSFFTLHWIEKVLKYVKKNGKIIINTSSKSIEKSLNFLLVLRKIDNEIKLINLNGIYIIIIHK